LLRRPRLTGAVAPRGRKERNVGRYINIYRTQKQEDK